MKKKQNTSLISFLPKKKTAKKIHTLKNKESVFSVCPGSFCIKKSLRHVDT